MIWIDTHFHGGEYLPDFAAYLREAEETDVRRLSAVTTANACRLFPAFQTPEETI